MTKVARYSASETCRLVARGRQLTWLLSSFVELPRLSLAFVAAEDLRKRLEKRTCLLLINNSRSLKVMFIVMFQILEALTGRKKVLMCPWQQCTGVTTSNKRTVVFSYKWTYIMYESSLIMKPSGGRLTDDCCNTWSLRREAGCPRMPLVWGRSPPLPDPPRCRQSYWCRCHCSTQARLGQPLRRARRENGRLGCDVRWIRPSRPSASRSRD